MIKLIKWFKWKKKIVVGHFDWWSQKKSGHNQFFPKKCFLHFNIFSSLFSVILAEIKSEQTDWRIHIMPSHIEQVNKRHAIWTFHLLCIERSAIYWTVFSCKFLQLKWSLNKGHFFLLQWEEIPPGVNTP